MAQSRHGHDGPQPFGRGVRKPLRGRFLTVAIAVAGALALRGPVAAASQAAAVPRDEQVAISPTRELHLECRGTGSPTVVFISGGVNSAAIWSMPYDFDHPT